MGFIQGLADVAAIIITLEVLVMLVVPVALIAFFSRKGMGWLLGTANEEGKYTWAIGKAHMIAGMVNKGVHRAEDIAVTPVLVTAGLAAGADTTFRSLRRRLQQPLTGRRRST